MLTISQKHHDEILAHCRKAYPKEGCSILAGVDGVVEQVYPMRNAEDSPVGYSMDPKEQLDVEKRMRIRGQQMVGICHSHTASEAYPSPVDVSLAISPDISYVIVSFKYREHPKAKSYRIDGAKITEEQLLISKTES